MILLLAFLLAAPGSQKLSQVHTIYVAPFNDKERTEDALRKALEAAGFTLVDDASKAEATLSGKHDGEITVDGGPEDYSKAIFRMHLVSVTGEVLWQETVRIIESSAEHSSAPYYAKRIVDGLIKARKRAASKGK